MEKFKFKHGGKTYEFDRTIGVIQKPGFIRKNRNRTETDMLFTMFEAVAGEDALEVIDEMDPDDFEAVTKAFVEHIQEHSGAPVEKS